MRRAAAVLFALAPLAACGGDGSLGNQDPADARVDADEGCPREPGPADRARKVVVSHPYGEGGAPARTYRVLDLSADGELSDPSVTFELGRATIGRIAFTPDGRIGLVPQQDGTIGVFRFDDDGQPVVVHEAFDGAAYATDVVVAPDGHAAWVVDTNWRENGGGIYRIDLACDGTITERGRWILSKLPAGLHVRGDRAVLAAADVEGSAAGDDVHLLDWDRDPPARLAGADAFGDDAAIVGGTALTADGAHLLIGDTSAFSGVPNRVAVVAVDAGALTAAQVISPVEDPIAIVASPHGDVALVVSGFGDALFVLDRTPGADTPFALRGQPTYQGGRPQLPGSAVVVERGALAGLALIAENQGVRRVRMSGGGTVTDLGLHRTGDGIPAITGAIGVQP